MAARCLVLTLALIRFAGLLLVVLLLSKCGERDAAYKYIGLLISMDLIETQVDQLFLPSDTTVHQVLDCSVWAKDHGQLPDLPRAIWYVLMYLSLPQAIVVCEADLVVVCCGTAEAGGETAPCYKDPGCTGACRAFFSILIWGL